MWGRLVWMWDKAVLMWVRVSVDMRWSQCGCGEGSVEMGFGQNRCDVGSVLMWSVSI